MKTYIALFALMLSSVQLTVAQQKHEVETKINESKVPTKAIQFVDQIQSLKRLKWYYEEDVNRSSVEAKAKHKGKNISIEFSMDGELEDVEVEECPANFNEEAREPIKTYFIENFEDYSIQKLQYQYIGSKENLLALLNDSIREQIELNFELVVDVKKDNKMTQYEFLFNELGELQSKKIIILSQGDVLNF